ncbi:MAG: hypothetical protein Q7T05_05120 [Dehalococcoidia bacterium]|nr:hypothetical protein [Dehalococcoidia bacterium]
MTIATSNTLRTLTWMACACWEVVCLLFYLTMLGQAKTSINEASASATFAAVLVFGYIGTRSIDKVLMIWTKIPTAVLAGGKP